jgi:transposase
VLKFEPHVPQNTQTPVGVWVGIECTKVMGARLLLEDISDDEWALMKERIPEADSAKEARSLVIRQSVNAILWRMRTGEPWRFIPLKYGESTSIFRRFQKWSGTGVWEDVTKLLAEMRSADRRLDLEPAFKTRSAPLGYSRAADHSSVL